MARAEPPAGEQLARLAASRGWHALVHYEQESEATRSLVVDPEFFLHPEGRENPVAELRATWEAIRKADDDGGEEHPACRFPARAAWLHRELGLEPPDVGCPRLERWKEELHPEGLTLVFPEAYLNNPSSLFGHTLLRLDRKEWEDDTKERDYLAYAVNFAAETGDDNAIAFAWKGILGFYPGYYSLLPYYEKIRQYGDWEQRDIWSYRLDLTPEQIDMLLLHLWELRGVAFRYFFFDDNCSYQILALLEVARPDLHLREQVPPWVIPVDTLRPVVEAGVVTDVRYRASATTRIRAGQDTLSPAARRLARELAQGRIDPGEPEVDALPSEERAAALSIAHDLVRRRLGSDVSPETRERLLAILRARSRIPVRGDALPDVTRPAVRPEDGHGSNRVRLGGGVRDGEAFAEFRIRPAFHEILDPSGGYTDGAQIVFLDLAVRWNELRGPAVEEFVLLDITSIAARDALFRPVSWRFRTGLENRLVENPRGDMRDANVWRTGGGAGLAYDVTDQALVYTFAGAALDLARQLRPAWAAAPTIEPGLFVSVADDRWKAHLHGAWRPWLLGDHRGSWMLALDQRLSPARDWAIDLRLSLDHDFGKEWSEAGLFLSRYF